MTAPALRDLPKIDRIVAHPSLAEARRDLGTSTVTALARAVVAQAREAVLAGAGCPSLEEVATAVGSEARARAARRTRRVINATGVILHTNLGRAPLAASAVEALAATAGGYVSLELDLSTGKRGGRGAYAERALAELAGAEAALVVNNNAAAVLLALSATAAGRGVLVSRGELVEIGGGFRIPEVLLRSGTRMIEVGTTNKTRASDFAEALERHPDVAAILRVHPGNFRQTGFVARPSLPELAALASSRRVTLIEDLGGGLLLPPEAVGLQGEPAVGDSVAAGVDLVCFSTDKALGGPQGGAIVGKRAAIEVLRRDPLARALRLGRLPLVALEATATLLLRGEPDAVPALAALRAPTDAVRARAGEWARSLRATGVPCEVVAIEAVAGGGAFAEESLSSAGIALDGPAEELLARLRTGEPPVLARIRDGRATIDARTVLPSEDRALLDAIRHAATQERA